MKKSRKLTLNISVKGLCRIRKPATIMLRRRRTTLVSRYQSGERRPKELTWTRSEFLSNGKRGRASVVKDAGEPLATRRTVMAVNGKSGQRVSETQLASVVLKVKLTRGPRQPSLCLYIARQPTLDEMESWLPSERSDL
jgi:hypothetical protein